MGFRGLRPPSFLEPIPLPAWFFGRVGGMVSPPTTTRPIHTRPAQPLFHYLNGSSSSSLPHLPDGSCSVKGQRGVKDFGSKAWQ